MLSLLLSPMRMRMLMTAPLTKCFDECQLVERQPSILRLYHHLYTDDAVANLSSATFVAAGI